MAVPTLKLSVTSGNSDINLPAAGLSATSYTTAAWYVIGPGNTAFNLLLAVQASGQFAFYSYTGVQSSDMGVYGYDTFNNALTGKIDTVAVGDMVYVAQVISGTNATYYLSKNGAAFVSVSRSFSAPGRVPGMVNLLAAGSIDLSTSSVSHARVWNAALTPAELLAERDSVTPVRTTGLWSAATLANTTTGLSDVSGNARNWAMSTGLVTAGATNTYLPRGIARRGMALINGRPTRITDAQRGTGLKPLVLLNGRLAVRQAGEGTPLVYVGGLVRGLQVGEVLEG